LYLSLVSFDELHEITAQSEHYESNMDLISIENLCLGAEVIIVLLLIAFAWTPNGVSGDDESNAKKEIMDWTPSKLAFLQSSLFRGLYVQNWKGTAGGPTKPFLCSQGIEGEMQSEIPGPWQDRLTKLTNRQGFDSLLREWTSISSEHRKRSCLSMITLNEYSQILAAHGAMATESAIRAFANHLKQNLENEAFVSRYQSERFMVLSFASNESKAFETMQRIREEAASTSFFEFQGTSLPVACIVSVTPIEGNESTDSIIDLLEEGYLHADDNKCGVVSRSNQAWTDKPPVPNETEPSISEASAKASDDSKKQFLDSQLEPSESTSNVDVDSLATSDGTAQPSEDTNTLEPSSDVKAAEVQPQEEAENSNDITAVADPDDIEALFAQIRNNKQQDKPSPVPAPPPATAPAEPTLVETSVSDVASADDIAALFASAKPAASPPKAAVKAAAPVTPVAAPAVSAAPVATPVAAATAVEATDAPAVQAAADPVVEIDDTAQTASADDIAALFAANKPKAPPKNPTPPAPPVSAAQPESAPVAQQPLVTMPKVPDPSPVLEPVASIDSQLKPEELGESEKAELATADDIAALFASVKQGIGTPPKTPTPVTPSPAPAPSSSPVLPPASAAPISQSEPAAPNDLSSQPVQTPQPSSPPPMAAAVAPAEADLSETASADDIAALFASLKK
jgi:diguanylate cyclase (GGDEF)-like protein